MENYRQILEYPNYEVSDLGNVRRIGKEVILKPIDNGKGYKLAHLSNNKGRRLCLIHRLVMITFSYIENNMDVNHIDGNKANNILLNLEWITKSNNTRHAHLTGLFSRRNKLTIEQVTDIKYNERGSKATTLSYKYGVKASVISKIWSGYLYPYV